MVTLDGSGSTVSSTSTGTLDFEWTGPMGPLGSTNSIDISMPGDYTLSVIDDVNGCSSTTSITIGEDTNPPVAAIFAGSNGTLVCGQSDLLLDANGSTTGTTTGMLEYTWFDQAGNMVGTGSTFSATSAQTYTVEVLNTSNGCVDQIDQVVMQDNNVPTISAIVQGDLTCLVSSVVLDGSASTASTPGTTLTYEWIAPNGMVVGTSAMLDATMPGAYTLTITDTDNMCTATNTSVMVMENMTEPTADIEAINGTSILCDMPSLVFNGMNSSTTTGATLTYEWFLNGTSIGTMPDVEAGAAGTLMLVVTDSDNGCSGSTSVTLNVDADVPNIVITPPSALTCQDLSLIHI